MIKSNFCFLVDAIESHLLTMIKNLSCGKSKNYIFYDHYSSGPCMCVLKYLVNGKPEV